MAAPVERSRTHAAGQLPPYLSHSRVNKYLTCPEQYRLYYVEGYRTRLPAASLEFGHCVHKALAGLFTDGLEAVETFVSIWDEYRDRGMRYAYRENWQKLRERGEALLTAFQEDEVPRITNVQACESSFEIQPTSLDVPFIGVIDLHAAVDGRSTIVDFKTAGSKYAAYEAALNDQLTAYQLAKPEAEQSALCVLVKTKEPRIEWHFANRTGADLVEYLRKVTYVAGEIGKGAFYKRTGKWCASCDFLPLCTGDHEQAGKSLVRVA